MPAFISATTPTPCPCCGEGCPPYTGLMLPFLTEATDIWYINEATAQAVMDTQTADCLAFTDRDPGDYAGFTFSGVFSSGVLTLAANATDDADSDVASLSIIGSLNIAASGTISVGWTYSATGSGDTSNPDVGVFIYNEAGVLVASFSAVILVDGYTGTFVTGSLPAGRYMVLVSTSALYYPEPETTYGVTAVISSTAALTANPPVALYDIGVECPGMVTCEL